MTRLLVIGAAGLDWADFEARSRRGDLPRLAALRGVAGWLRGAAAIGGVAPWVSLVTGVEPERHGVWRPFEPGPGGLRPVSRASWRQAPVWDRLAEVGIATGSVAWPAARPGADWRGVHVDGDVAQASARDPADWALPLHGLPREHRDAVRARRVHPAQISAAMLAPLVPQWDAIDQTRDALLPALAVAMARTATIHAIASWMLTQTATQAAFVHLPWLADLRATFETPRDSRFGGVLDGAWRFLDGLVGALAERAGPEALVMLVAPGFGDRAGVLLAQGPGVANAPSFAGADLLDIAPTVLARFGLEDGALPGRSPTLIVPAGPRVAAPVPPLPSPVVDDPVLMRIVCDAGYTPPTSPGPEWAAQGLAELALSLIERAPQAAAEAADAALALHPYNVLALRLRVRAHVALSQAAPLPALAETLLRLAPGRGWGALAWAAYHLLEQSPTQAAPWLRQAESDADPGTRLTLAALLLAAERTTDAERIFRLILDGDPGSVTAEVGVAMAALARRDFIVAEQALLRALAKDPSRPVVRLQLAQLYARTGRRSEARRAAAAAVRLGAAPELAAASRAGVRGEG